MQMTHIFAVTVAYVEPSHASIANYTANPQSLRKSIQPDLCFPTHRLFINQ